MGNKNDYKQTYTQTNRQTNRHTHKQTDTYTSEQTNRRISNIVLKNLNINVVKLSSKHSSTNYHQFSQVFSSVKNNTIKFFALN